MIYDWQAGLNLFLVLIPLLSLVLGTFNVVTVGLCFVIYTQLNVLNHRQTRGAPREYVQG